jgi:hypothetical protein
MTNCSALGTRDSALGTEHETPTMKGISMKYFIVLGLLLLTLPACALLDAFVGTEAVHATDADGAPLYVDAEGRTTTADAGPDGPHKPLKIDLVDAQTPGVAKAAEHMTKLGPWGALAGGIATLLAGAYARGRNRRLLSELGMRKQAEQQLDLTGSALTFAVQLVEKIKEGRAVPTDENGRINVADLKRWVFEQGGRFEDPHFLAEVVRIANAALPRPERQEALRHAKTPGERLEKPGFAG